MGLSALPTPQAAPALQSRDQAPAQACTTSKDAESLAAQRTAIPSSARLCRVTAEQLPSFRRLISLLLPVRYPDRFYTTLLSNPDGDSISRAALWYPAAAAPEDPERRLEDASALVVGGVCARVETVTSEGADPTPTGAKELYIQTLAVLSPYRGRGLASALLEAVVGQAVMEAGVSSVYAHVWESNNEALEWYRRRGFTYDEEVLSGYYRRLQPNGARVVRKRVGVADALKGMIGERANQ